MRTFAIAVLLSVAGVCVGQQPAKTTSSTISGVVTEGRVIAHPVRPPDKPCDAKYEYSVIGADEKGYKEVCAPILHTVTEKEWAELMERISLMQKLLNISENKKPQP